MAEVSLAEKLYNYDYERDDTLTSEEVAHIFGDIAAIYAIDNNAYFNKQLKHSKFFFGPYMNDIKCIGTPMPLVTQPFQIEPPQQLQVFNEQVATKAKNYYIDIFAHDPSKFTITNARLDDKSIGVNKYIADLLVKFKYPLMQKPPIGGRAFITREEFNERVNKLLCKSNGEPDKNLIDVWNGAGKLDASVNQSYELAGSNYCIAGGSISKLLDPYINSDNLRESDIDIFVFGDIINQRYTIEKIVRMLFEHGTTYITIRGGVVNIRRCDCMDVQIVSVSSSNPMSVVRNFDVSNVMCYWFAGTVHVNAACVNAFRTRVVKYGKNKKFIDARILKIIKYGFAMRISSSLYSNSLIAYIHRDNEKDSFITKLVTNLTRFHITKGMKDYEILARITQSDNGVHDIITENPSANGPISDLMIVGSAIDVYASFSLKPEYFNKTILDDVKTCKPGSRIFIYIAGFRARIKCIINKLLSHDKRTLRVLFNEISTRNIMEIVDILNKKMIAEGKEPLKVDATIMSVANDKMDAKVMISEITSHQSFIENNRKSLMVGFTIYCESANVFRLELTYI